MVASENSGKAVPWLIGAIVLIAACWVVGDRLNHWYRKTWRFHPPYASMQDLPAVDRSNWPKSPAAWSNEPVEVPVATPEGLRQTNITYLINSIGMKLVRIEPGTFVMGLDAETSKDVGPSDPLGGPMYVPHRVTLTKPYYLGAFEVSNAQYDRYDTEHKHHRPAYQLDHDANTEPVEPISWQDAQRFCRWLSAQEGRSYRLPTEAEWEYACRAGTTNRTYWGGDVLDRTKANLGWSSDKKNHAHYANDGFEYTAPVGSFPANPWGLHDMLGNSWEWVSDWYSVFPTNDAVDPQGPPTGHCRVDKGGSWNTGLRYTCSALRDGDDPGDLKDTRGFRVVCEVP
ncbi:MAG TPA: formylglycine-generating enzyme family protein [Verrucomicrobiae bacterium]|nr:formylglycine-generating enzyme family protein [Verrucomicrobiae bacterium]